MSNQDITEFWVNRRHMLTAKSSHRIMVSELVNIQSITYKVSQVTFAVDRANDPFEAKVVQAVQLVKMTK